MTADPRAAKAGVLVYEGNACWEPRSGLGRTGPWATFGLATDDGQRFEVSSFGPLAEQCARVVRKGARLRVESKHAPKERSWVARGVERQGRAVTASAVTVLDPLPAGEATQRIIERMLAMSSEEVLGA